jgi:hypothetical protein
MILRNPTGKKKKKSTTSAATRAKISRAVKAAQRRAKAPASRAVARRASSTVTIVAPAPRRSSRRTRKSFRSMSRSVGRATRRIGRRIRRSAVGGMNIRGIFSKENLTMAGGAFAGAYLTGMILNNFSFARQAKDANDSTKLKDAGKFTLPFTTPDKEGKVLGEAFYGLAIPVAGAYLIRRTSPAAAKGMIILGVFNVFNTVVNMFASKPKEAPAASTAGKTGRYMGEYVKYTPRDTKPAITFGNPPGYMATNVTGRVSGPYDSAAAYAKAW